MSKKVLIRIPINLHPAQKQVDDSTARFKVVMTGCRFGKTEYGIKYLLDGAAKRPGSKNWIIFPYAKQGRSVLWNRLLGFIPEEIRAGKPNKTLMDIPLVNGSEIGIRGSDNEQSLRGERLGRVIQDEAASQKSHVWEEILRPRLLDYRGEALFISSPFGKNWFYKLWEQAGKNLDPEWAAWHFTTYDNPYISREELDKLRITTPPRIWRREYMGEALDDEGIVYGEYNTLKNRFDPRTEFIGHESAFPCGRGMDWGTGVKGDPAACVWVHISPKQQILVSKVHSQQNWSVARHAEAIRGHSVGRRVLEGLTVLDQSAFRQEGTSQTSVARLFSANGIQCMRSEVDKESGISIVKALLESSSETKLLISDDCPEIHKALQEWEFGQHEPDVLAALRYILVIMYRRGMFKLDNLYVNNSAEPETKELNPMSFFDQKRIRELSDPDEKWNYDDGCFE